MTATADDCVLPFSVEALDVRGRVARLGSSLDQILRRHDYPPAVSRLLGEAVILNVLFATALKMEGRVVLQIQSDGPVSLLVTDFTTPEGLRGYARFDAEAVAELGDSPALRDIVGEGTMALTIDPKDTVRRYQGIVEMTGDSLEEVAHRYFSQSEQIPTMVRLAVAETMERRPGEEPRRIWRGGGVTVQFLPDASERIVVRDIDPGDAPEDAAQDQRDQDDAWVEAAARTQSAQDHELVDPEISAERLLLRLFNERDVRVFDPFSLSADCHCSTDKIQTMLGQFSADDRASMVEDGAIKVTCEFCNTEYVLDPDTLQERGTAH
ncbi:Hsp33 family molecular chaperone [Acuticoccus sp. I52.16.1]|uniref:Hsp33 family molecular chaperone n=1 Tax=Acuticoccus sp. I52.16.1 TaxID=2928472 RepID=UPI001FD3E11A|nr:Hsp33 family molecular chaperone [Acuticoccus sp. I52.16.1]UOM32765.1 Hsp33 family molecular chaperone [Acuticoccus sp. I52.16.1]